MTANERFKAQIRRRQIAATIAAIALHVLVFALTPTFRAEGSLGRRMIVSVGTPAPPATADLPRDYVAFDTATMRLLAANVREVNNRLPRIYPWSLWHHREESSARLELAITRSGRVHSARLLESSDNGADMALLELAQRLRFDIDLPDRARGVVAGVEMGVLNP